MIKDAATACSQYTGWDQTCCKCIVGKESGGNNNAVNENSNGSYDVGLWQINSGNWGAWYVSFSTFFLPPLFIFPVMEELLLVMRQQTLYVPNMSGNKEEVVSNFGLLAALVAAVEHPQLPLQPVKLPKQVKRVRQAKPLKLPIPVRQAKPLKLLIPVRQAKPPKLLLPNRPLTAQVAVILYILYLSEQSYNFIKVATFT